MELFMTDQRKCYGLLLLGVQIILAASSLAQTVSVPEPPQVRGKNHVVSLTLDAVNEDGRDAFAFNGATVAPVIRVSPGDVLKITYINHLPAKSEETCAVNPCMPGIALLGRDSARSSTGPVLVPHSSPRRESSASPGRNVGSHCH